MPISESDDVRFDEPPCPEPATEVQQAAWAIVAEVVADYFAFKAVGGND